jgi:sugar O-acyltransferase (sialic acid O-acetyltransferase NeuD family)
MNYHKILAEKYNASDNEYKIILNTENSKRVEAGQVICEVETSKATFEVVSEYSGWIYFNPDVSFNGKIESGETIAIVFNSKDDCNDMLFTSSANMSNDQLKPVNFTQKAFRYCLDNNINLELYAEYELVTEEILKKKSESLINYRNKDKSGNLNKILILGACGHGLELVDIIQSNRIFDFAGFVDPVFGKSTCYMGHEIIGDDSHLQNLRESGISYAAVAAGWLNIELTKKLIQKVLEAGFILPNLVHPTAYIYPSAKLLGGVQVFANSVIGASAKIGFCSVVQNLSLVSHDCKIGEAVFIAPGAKIAGNVEIGDYSIIGMNSTIYLRVKLEKYTIVNNNKSIY